MCNPMMVRKRFSMADCARMSDLHCCIGVALSIWALCGPELGSLHFLIDHLYTDMHCLEALCSLCSRFTAEVPFNGADISACPAAGGMYDSANVNEPQRDKGQLPAGCHLLRNVRSHTCSTIA